MVILEFHLQPENCFYALELLVDDKKVDVDDVVLSCYLEMQTFYYSTSL